MLLKRDPNLWMVKCRAGEEKATVLLLMRKFLTFQNTNEPLQIKSVVAPEGVKGYIYVEAYKQTHTKAAIAQVGNLRIGQWKQEVCYNLFYAFSYLKNFNIFFALDGTNQGND